MKSLPVAVCLLQHKGRIPLIRFKRNHLVGYWGLPGGKFDDGEHLPEAAEREMGEEIEALVKFGRFLGLVDEIVESPEGSMRVILHICTVTLAGRTDFGIIDKPEGRIEWFTHAQIDAMEPEFVASDFSILKGALAGTLQGYYRCHQTVFVDARPRLNLFEPVA